jgi:hypothetical protein
MSPALARERVEQALEAVRGATRAVTRAAEAAEADAVQAGIAQRGAAVASLCETLAAEGDLDPCLAQDWREALVLDALDAEIALRRLLVRTSRLLRSAAEGGRALRGYAAHPDEPSALDRSG